MPALLPRVLIVSDDQWLRAGLRGELRERGYDAVGARDLEEARRTARPEPGRGPVRLVIVDQGALGDETAGEPVLELRRAIWDAPVVLIAPGNRRKAEGQWSEVLRRPISVGEIVRYVARVLPEGRATGPLDL